MKRGSFAAVFLALALVMGGLSGCVQKLGAGTQQAQETELYATQQEMRPSPEWVTALDAAREEGVQQLIVVAGVDKSTAYITMHEKDKDGTWQQIIATPGFYWS